MKSFRLNCIFIDVFLSIILLSCNSCSNIHRKSNYSLNKEIKNFRQIENNTSNSVSNSTNIEYGYETLTYETIIVNLLELSKNFSSLLELKNNLDFDLEFPEGSCGVNKCHIPVARLTNMNITNDKTIKTKLLFNCGYNGIDNITPIICFEFI